MEAFKESKETIFFIFKLLSVPLLPAPPPTPTTPEKRKKIFWSFVFLLNSPCIARARAIISIMFILKTLSTLELCEYFGKIVCTRLDLQVLRIKLHLYGKAGGQNVIAEAKYYSSDCLTLPKSGLSQWPRPDLSLDLIQPSSYWELHIPHHITLIIAGRNKMDFFFFLQL